MSKHKQFDHLDDIFIGEFTRLKKLYGFHTYYLIDMFIDKQLCDFLKDQG